MFLKHQWRNKGILKSHQWSRIVHRSPHWAEAKSSNLAFLQCGAMEQKQKTWPQWPPTALSPTSYQKVLHLEIIATATIETETSSCCANPNRNKGSVVASVDYSRKIEHPRETKTPGEINHVAAKVVRGPANIHCSKTRFLRKFWFQIPGKSTFQTAHARAQIFVSGDHRRHHQYLDHEHWAVTNLELQAIWFFGEEPCGERERERERWHHWGAA